MKVRVATLCALVALVAALVPLPSAGAALTFQVEVGRFFDEADHTAESMRFYPAAIEVVPGDTLHFSTESFHGVTLLPAGSEPTVWRAAHAEPGGPWAAFQTDPDESSTGARINLKVALPSSPCGWPGQSPCEFDGSGDELLGPLNSGLAVFPAGEGTETRELSFSVTITAEPGTTIYALDPLHPAMTMQIDVAGTFEERSDLGTLQSQSDAQFAADRARAAQLDTTYSKKKVKKTVGGKTVWQAWAGVEEQGVSLRRLYPKRLTIKPGHRVRWIFAKNIYEAHSITFPRARAMALSGAFPEIACDVDGDEGLGPDEAPSSAQFPFCSSLGELELDVPAALAAGAGNRAVTSTKDLEASGARGASYASTAAAYTLAFPKKSPKSGFPYACAIHEAAHAPMRGAVVVKR